MKNPFQLPENGSNYAWSFDGVPEENSLLLGFGPVVVETPAVNLVFSQPRALLGERVHARFGTEFPIRFDMLDTIHGQNLSLQVHPLTEYIQEAFNMRYTQDESYYILDTEGEEAAVWLGLRTGIDPATMERESSTRSATSTASPPTGTTTSSSPREPCTAPGATPWSWRSAPRPTSSPLSCGTGAGWIWTASPGPSTWTTA